MPARPKGVPRTRGDEPIATLPARRRVVFPARAGMNRIAMRNGVIMRHVFPARAGMNRVGDAAGQQSIGVPRTRGDEPPRRNCASTASRVFPARAGMNRSSRAARLPRLACSPHARG